MAFRNSLNKVTLIGHLGKDPEVRYTPAGDAVAEVSLATTEVFKNKDGERSEKTEWHNLVIWRSQAEYAKEYLKKGQLLYVEGKLQNRQWEDREGQKRQKTEIQVNQIISLGGMAGRQKEATGDDRPVVPPAEEEDIPF